MNGTDTPDTKPPLSWRTNDYALEEYRALMQHYFHEDMYFLKAVGLFATLNAGLLTVFGSSLIASAPPLVKNAFPLIGLVSTVAWAVTLIRVRHLRRSIEKRIQTLENALKQFWKADPPPFPLLQIRDRQEAGTLLQRIPASSVMLLFPASFFVIWMIILMSLVK